MKIYLAGPDVFLPDAVEIGRQKAAICAAHGLTGVYPLDNAIDLTSPDASLSVATIRRDLVSITMIRSVLPDAMNNLDPSRLSVSADG